MGLYVGHPVGPYVNNLTFLLELGHHRNVPIVGPFRRRLVRT